jgi:hypothetical protein
MLLRFILPFAACAVGSYVAFYKFWHGFDAVPGDLGDARFNTIVLEHTWLWLKGVHHSLFDMPMFAPFPNTYAYSDYLFGSAPIYWCFRSFGLEPHLSFVSWMVASGALNCLSYTYLVQRFFIRNVWLATFAGYVFAYSLPHLSFLNHAQTFPAFFIVLSAIGALLWFEKPTSQIAPWLFFTGAALQFISGYYFFWFWLWTLATIAAYALRTPERRKKTITFLRAISKPQTLLAILVNAAYASPFLFHYLLAAKEFGRRGWVDISNSVPRLYSWFAIPRDHWEWSVTPFRSWILSLPMLDEQTISLGLITWAGCIFGLVHLFRKRSEYRFMTIPILTTLFFTLTSGRISLWALVSYFFPGGGAIRAVGRIQIFFLLFWGVILAMGIQSLWNSKIKWRRSLAIVIVLGFFAENIYISEWTFSRAESNSRIAGLMRATPPDCEVLIHQKAIQSGRYQETVDTVLAAFALGKMTVNGYSGNSPSGYNESLMHPEVLQQRFKTCTVE